ncbi:MAG TPA: hypothetical protein ENF98_00600 [Candidatus Bathyarchaeota archaeon]|nr:hypothetical protein [Candidatus Bathyarchaeota archaeon]
MRKPSKRRRSNLVRWLRDIIPPDEPPSLELSIPPGLRVTTPRRSLCVVCKGSRMLCGKRSCPIVARLKAYLRSKVPEVGVEVDGSSPPSVFVGRYGYPYVNVSPLTPPVHGDTSLYDMPELWFGMGFEEIASFRVSLIGGKFRVHVRRFRRDRLVDKALELAMSERPVDSYMELAKKPVKRFILDDEVQPMGPSAPLKQMDLDNPKWDRRLERAYYDGDLRASEAVEELYLQGVPVTKIQTAFSVGAFGLERLRRLVPTRWSITAVDSIVSKSLITKLRDKPTIDEYRVYQSEYLGNRFVILLAPGPWTFELFEAWQPNTLWNPEQGLQVAADWEGYRGRTSYSSLGGGYYAARMAVAEALYREGRQATAVVFREVTPDYIMPVGVWQVRENVRNAMAGEALRFDTLGEALSYVWSRLRVRPEDWVRPSRVLRTLMTQRRIPEYV